MIDNLLLYYLVVFSENGSLLKSSELLHISQPSLSKAMKKLEDELDLTIFERQANKMKLNEAGIQLLPYAKEIVEMDEHIRKKAIQLRNSLNTISIGYTAPGIIYKYPELFASSNQNVKITTSLDKESTLINSLNDNTYDIIFINKKIENNELICKKIMTEHLYISIPPTHFLSGMKNGVTFKDIDGQSFLLFSYIGIWKDILNKNLHRSRFIENTNMDDLKELNEYSSIPSFVTDISKTKNFKTNRITIPILDDDAYLNFYAIYKKSKSEIIKFLK